jgi:DNA-binding SARP family transcriptional activator
VAGAGTGGFTVRATASPDARAVHGPASELRLLGGFSLQVDGTTVALPMHSRRVLAYLSLDHGEHLGCDRGVLAERLWPDAGTERSRASLRTALWRIRRVSEHLVLVEPDAVRLGHGVSVDVHRFRRVADRINDDEDDHLTAESARILTRSTELLPGWDESWLVLAREQLRQARLHAIEANAAHLRRARRFPEAIDAMLDVIAEEPLRESAHAALIDVYLSEGNASEAVRQFDSFAALLWHELGIRPSRALCARVGLELPAGPQGTDRAQVSPRTRPRSPAHAAP